MWIYICRFEKRQRVWQKNLPANIFFCYFYTHSIYTSILCRYILIYYARAPYSFGVFFFFIFSKKRRNMTSSTTLLRPFLCVAIQLNKYSTLVPFFRFLTIRSNHTHIPKCHEWINWHFKDTENRHQLQVLVSA